jgi:two-component system, NarL family, nitrate/nitrite response regulator NarL
MTLRLLLCNDHRLFAESLALVLGEAGFDIVAVTHSYDETLAELGRHDVDVCVLDLCQAPGPRPDRLAKVRAAAPVARIVLLSRHSHAADPLLDTTGGDGAGTGACAVVYRDQGITDIVRTIERVGAGHRVPHPDPTSPTAGDAAPARLTARERQVLGLLVRGKDTTGVARAMGVRPATARSHIQSVLKKLGAHTRIEAAAAAVRGGLVDAETGAWLPR